MATTGLAIKGGKLLTRDGKINITSAAGCDNCCCLECEFCEGCSVAEEPNCVNCGAPAGCCTPCEVEVVVSGVDAAKCVNCRIAGGQGYEINSLSLDGTHCATQVSPCVWEIRIIDGANISGRTVFNLDAPCGGTVCETRNVDIRIQVIRTAGSWFVEIRDAAPTVLICGAAIAGFVFNGSLVGSADCKATHGPISNTITCSGAGNTDAWSDGGTVTITPCCP